ncbi:MAG: TIGR01458 family HAD-type hydrolase [Chloroflexia bacterium]|nr:TIGR01458 family HAD-type hydrolase [Chloroflexia bacterium]
MSIDGLLLDIDGVLIQDGAAIPGAPDALRAIGERGLPFRLVTNGSQKSRATLARQLTALGFGIEAAAILTPATAAARYLRDRGTTAYLATREDTRADFRETGVAVDDQRPDYVVLGDLGEDLSYAELNRVLRFLLGGAELIALGRTRIWRAPDGPALDVGPIAALFEEATGVTAAVFGKPDPAVFREGARALGLDRALVAMVGDDAEVDVAAGRKAGLGAGLLVRTGKYRPGDESRHTPRPDVIYASFPAFAEALLKGEMSAEKPQPQDD